MSFPRYPKYKPSGVEWLGEVPEHWGRTRLKQLYLELDTRLGDGKSELLGLSKSLGIVRRSEMSQSASDSDDYSKYKLARAGDVVMNKMQAWNGVFGISPVDGMVSPDYSVFAHLRPSLATFLCHLLRTDAMAGEFFTRSRGMGTAFLRLNTSDFLDTVVFIPDVREARAIAAFLDRETAKIDALIAEQEKLIELLAEKRQAVISHAVTKGLNPAAPMKPSGVEWLGDVPEHWSVTRLKGLCRLVTEKADSRNRAVALEHIESGSGRLVGDSGEFEGEGTAFVQGDLLFGKLRPYLAKAWVAEFNGEAVGDFHVMRPTRELSQRYLLYTTLNRDFIQLVDGSTYGSKMPRASWDFVGCMPVCEPSLAEQRAIAAFLDRETDELDGLVNEAEKGIELLRERRSALISAAVTGQIDVRNAVPETAA